MSPCSLERDLEVTVLKKKVLLEIVSTLYYRSTLGYRGAPVSMPVTSLSTDGGQEGGVWSFHPTGVRLGAGGLFLSLGVSTVDPRSLWVPSKTLG